MQTTIITNDSDQAVAGPWCDGGREPAPGTERFLGVSSLLLAALLVFSAGCHATVDSNGSCGDGVVDTGESCDDGNTGGGDYCSADCQTVTGYCGDGTQQSNEACDDGNADDGDYCTADCQTETGSCGDGTQQSNEACDDGNADDGDYCSADCQTVTGHCGDGTQQSNEACDDGNADGGDYCSAGCQTVTGSCGDGIQQSNEGCDDGNESVDDNCPDGAGGSCQDAVCGDGFIWADHELCDDGNGVLTDACPDGPTGSCEPAVCGDGFVEAATEACDDGNTDAGDYCAADCQAVTGSCGDGIQQTTEACDDGNTGGGDYCAADCQTVTGSCGDGTQQAIEACDDGNTDAGDYCAADCQTVTGSCGDGIQQTIEACDDGNTGGGDYCSADCQTVTGSCGDGIQQAIEQCDDGNADNTDDCPSTCLSATCGDGFVRAGFETCDDGNSIVTDDCPDGVAGTCTPASCGDGYIWTDNEECDEGAANADNDSCKTDCTAAACGDGYVWTGNEECDGGNDLDGDGCSASCTIEVPALSVPGATGGWIEVLVDPTANDMLYAVDVTGMVHRSLDAGTSWTPMCRNPSYRDASTTMLVASKGKDRSVYVTAHTRIYRVAALAGSDCTSVTSTLGTVYGYSATTCFTPTQDGKRLYAWSRAVASGAMWTSDDLGETWTQLEHDIQSDAFFGFISPDPFNPQTWLVMRAFAGDGQGLYRTTDGKHYTLVSTDIASHVIRVAYDPVNPDWVYASNGHFSDDGGATWQSDNRYAMSTDWELDEAGAGYKLVDTGTATELYVAADMRDPTWVSLSAFPASNGYPHVSVAGDTVAMAVGGTIWVSTDAGSSFDEAAAAQLAAPELTSLDSHDGQRLYATTQGWNVFTSEDSGTTWHEAYVPVMEMPPGTGRLRVGPVVGASENVIVFADSPGGSTYNSNLIVSHDGMQTAAESTGGINSWATTTAISRTDPLLAYQFGGRSQVTTDGGDTWTAISPNPFSHVWYPAEAWVHWSDSDIAWVVEQGGQLWEFDAATSSRTDIAANAAAELDDDLIAGLDVVDDGSGWSLRVISRTGNLAISSDGGITFAAQGSAPGLASCNRRYMASVPGFPDLLATACIGRSAGAGYSTDGGDTWTDLNDLTEWTNADCAVRDVVMTETIVLFACAGQSPRWVTHSEPTCGDGVAILPEQCDAGAGNSDAIPDLCRTDCRLPHCGDSVLDTGEVCEDGNLVDDDGCDSNCTVTACNNGVVTSGEECDDGDGNSDAAPNACRTDCSLPACGDGVPDSEYGEGCDDGTSNSDTTPGACRTDCRPARCGDGVVDAWEECDDNNIDPDDGCTDSCTVCGDGIITPPETCDDGSANANASDACRLNCTLPFCGDTIVDTGAGEECDDGNFQQGDGCTPICKIDTDHEAACDHVDDDGDGIIDEGCDGAVPSDLTTWQAYGFGYVPNNIECSGDRYIKSTGYSVGAYVGVILCSATRYKILLADDPAGLYYSVGDGGGSGQDHCEFVGAADQSSATVHNWRDTLVAPGYRRSSWGQEPTFGTIGNSYYSAASYECGVSIP